MEHGLRIVVECWYHDPIKFVPKILLGREFSYVYIWVNNFLLEAKETGVKLRKIPADCSQTIEHQGCLSTTASGKSCCGLLIKVETNIRIYTTFIVSSAGHENTLSRILPTSWFKKKILTKINPNTNFKHFIFLRKILWKFLFAHVRLNVQNCVYFIRLLHDLRIRGLTEVSCMSEWRRARHQQFFIGTPGMGV